MALVFAVDDEPALLRVIELSLLIEGFEVVTISSALDALSALSEGDHPDTIVLDLNMPGMDGREFYQLARQAGYENPVIIASAYNARAVSEELGADDWLSKPFAPAQLAEKVKGLSNGTQWRNPS